MATKKKQVSKKPAPSKSKPAKESPASKTAVAGDPSLAFAFGKENYRLLLIGLAVILLGFLLMIGGGSDDPNVFSEDIFNSASHFMGTNWLDILLKSMPS